MIALLNSYAELFNKLDTNEKSEIINKAIKDIKNEIIIYENYPPTVFIFKKLIDLKNNKTINLTPVKDINKIYGQLKKNYWQANSW